MPHTIQSIPATAVKVGDLIIRPANGALYNVLEVDAFNGYVNFSIGLGDLRETILTYKETEQVMGVKR